MYEISIWEFCFVSSRLTCVCLVLSVSLNEMDLSTLRIHYMMKKRVISSWKDDIFKEWTKYLNFYSLQKSSFFKLKNFHHNFFLYKNFTFNLCQKLLFPKRKKKHEKSFNFMIFLEIRKNETRWHRLHSS